MTRAVPPIIPGVEMLSGSQPIDGSLKFNDSANQHLKRTISAGNRRTFTLSAWVKHSTTDSNDRLLGNYTDSNNYSSFYFRDTPDFQISFVEKVSSTFNINAHSRRMARDTGWYHIVWAVDTTQATDTDRVKLYVNGVQETLNEAYSSGTLNTNAPTLPSENYDTRILAAYDLRVGSRSGTDCWDGLMSQFYVIDGQALGPEYFGYTDGLTNTWKPKKYEGTFGTNGFYLPMDGNSPIGQDKSGNGNDYTPVNFGGSVALDNPQVSGARPILNVTQGGTKAALSVFGSKENKFYVTTTANGSVYQFDITSGDNPSLEFIRGATYRFDYTSHASHPLRFSSTNPDSSTTAYTQGTNTSVSNVITITVPHDAPDTLYYYCTAHASGMNGAISVTTDETKADQYASNCVLGLPLVGSAADVSASIACTSSTKALTTNGNAAAASESSNFYSGSFEFDGTDDDVRYTSPGAIGTGDFTLECWVNFDVLNANQGVVDTRSDSNTNGFALLGRSDGTVSMADGTSLIGDAISASTGRWIHLAGSRSGSSLKFFVDGKLSSTVTNSTNFSNDRLIVGTIGGGTEDLNGYVQDVRFYLGVAKYTSNFVVPSTSPDILPDTPSGVAGGSKLTKITDGAVAFDGTGDELKVTDSGTDFQFGTGDFTVEAFVYYKVAPSSSRYIIDMRSSAGTDNAGALAVGYTGDNTKLQWAEVSAQAILEVSWADYFGANSWNHIAVARSGSTIKMFINGEEVDSATDNINYADPADITIGDRYTNSNATQYFDGFISNVRIVKGTALYTSNFTPPTEPLTNVTNTKLLTCQSTSLYAAVAPLVSGVNNGTVWSSSLTGDSLFRSGYPAVDAFNGVTKTSTEDCAATPQVAGQGFTFLFGGGVPFTTLQMQCDHNNGATVTANGVNITSQLSSGSLTNTTITGVTSPLTSLSVVSHNGDAGYLGSVTIDGTMLVDPFVPNGDVVATNFNPFITDINAVRGQETGYPTFNPLNNTTNTLSNGNTFVTGGSGWNTTLCTGEMTSGKWFIELIHRGRQSASDNDIQFGLFGLNDTEDGYPLPGSKDIAAQTTGYCIVDAQAQFYNNSSSTGYGITWDNPGDVVGMRFNADTGKLGFIINGVDQGDVTTTLPDSGGGYPNQRWVAAISLRGGNAKAEINFGQKPFKFPPPDGFQLLNDANLRPETVISRPDQYVGVVTYMGNDATTHSIRGLNFGTTPDLVWIKNIDQSEVHVVKDTIRGVASALYSSSNSAEDTGSTYSDRFPSFDVNGFTVGSTHTGTNSDGDDFVAWCWKAGGSKGTFNVDGVGYASAAAAGLTGGTITPSAATVGTKNGFSIIRFTGPGSAGFQSVPHGLGKKPNMIFCKDLDNARNWGVYQSDVIAGSDNIAFILNSTSQGFTSGTATWDVSEINETIFTPYFRDDFGASYGADNIAYVWCDIPGVQKFGTYDGNSSADGAMVICGFRPAMVMCKAYNGSQPWQIYDNQRGKINVIQNGLQWNSNNGQYTGTDRIDFLSNGFKLKGSGGVEPNVDGLLYVYAAWAEAPSVDLYGGGANAR